MGRDDVKDILSTVNDFLPSEITPEWFLCRAFNPFRRDDINMILNGKISIEGYIKVLGRRNIIDNGVVKLKRQDGNER